MMVGNLLILVLFTVFGFGIIQNFWGLEFWGVWFVWGRLFELVNLVL